MLLNENNLQIKNKHTKLIRNLTVKPAVIIRLITNSTPFINVNKDYAQTLLIFYDYIGNSMILIIICYYNTIYILQLKREILVHILSINLLLNTHFYLL